MTGIAEATRTYNAIGIITHPLTSPTSTGISAGKRPIKSGWSKLTEGMTEQEITSHILNKGCNIGAVCGRESDLMVIDVDWYIKGVWDDILKGADTSQWIKQYRTGERWHWLFKFNPDFELKHSKPLGMDLLGEAGNVVMSPSVHVSGETYQIDGDIKDRPELPDVVIQRIKETLALYTQLKISVGKCRPAFREFFDRVFEKADLGKDMEGNKIPNPLYHDLAVFRGKAGRDRTLHLCAELKANGATDDELLLLCKLVFCNSYEEEHSKYEISKVDGSRTAKTETILSDHILAQFHKEEYKQVVQESTSTSNEAVKVDIPEALKNTSVPDDTIERSNAFNQFLKDNMGHVLRKDLDIYTEYVTCEVKQHFGIKAEAAKSMWRAYKTNRRESEHKVIKGRREEDNKKNDNIFNGKYGDLCCVSRFGDVSLLIRETAEYLMEKLNIISYRGHVYTYDSGKYTEGEERIISEVLGIAADVGISGYMERTCSEIVHWVTYKTPCDEYPFNKCKNMINVSNCVVTWDKEGNITQKPHSPEYRFNYIFPVEYDPDAPDTLHTEVISKYVVPEMIEVLYQIPAQAIIQMWSNPFKKAYILHGDKNSGKSSLTDILDEVIGKDNISRESLQDLGERTFAKANLEGKLLNVYDDLSDVPMKEGGVIKTLTGKHEHSVEKKNIQGYPAHINAVHVYTCNTPPSFDNRIKNDTAFWERWVYVQFPFTFEVDETFIERMITPENLSGLLNRILQMVIQIQQTGLPIKQEIAEVRELWSFNSDPIYKYIEENIDKNANPVYVLKDDLLQSIQRWAQSNGVDMVKIPTTPKKLTQTVDKFEILPCRRVSMDDGLQKSVYSLPGAYYPNTPFAVNRIRVTNEQVKMCQN